MDDGDGKPKMNRDRRVILKAVESFLFLACILEPCTLSWHISIIPMSNYGNNHNPLPALTTEDDDTKSAGYLEICILSAYDLPAREPPQGIAITVAGHTVRTGPPIQRHKDRNSFKFASASGAGNQVQIRAPLSDLYPATATFSVVYEQDTGNEPLQVEYALHQLKIHDTQWIVLNLETGKSSGGGGGGSVASNEDDTFRVPPTLRFKLTLHGPYRTEVAAALQVASTWFGLVDQLEASGAVMVKNLPDPQWFLLPAVPLVAVGVVSTPIVAGVLVVALPMVLPVLVLVTLATTALAACGLALYASTQQGRQEWLQPLFQPAVDTLLATATGQQCIYQTGPRPTPVHLCRVILPQESLWGKLVISLWIDLMGSASYHLPVVGEGVDIAWAPLQTLFIMAMYDDIAPNLKYVSFVEEILPFTDIVPSATIGWLAEFGVPWVEQQLGWKLLPEQQQQQQRGGGGPLAMTLPSTPFSSPR